MPDRLPVIGFIAPRPKSGVRAQWHAWAAEAGMKDIAFDIYRAEPCTCPTCTKKTCLLLRLSEMYTLGRMGYALSTELQEAALRLIDVPTPEAVRAGKVDTIINRHGVLHGTVLAAEGAGEREIFWKRLIYWGFQPIADPRMAH